LWVTSKVVAMHSIRRVTDLKLLPWSPIGMTKQGATHVQNIYVLSDKDVGILVNAQGSISMHYKLITVPTI